MLFFLKNIKSFFSEKFLLNRTSKIDKHYGLGIFTTFSQIKNTNSTKITKIEGVIKLMNKDILITKEMLLVWNVKNVEQQNIVKMDL